MFVPAFAFASDAVARLPPDVSASALSDTVKYAPSAFCPFTPPANLRGFHCFLCQCAAAVPVPAHTPEQPVTKVRTAKPTQSLSSLYLFCAHVSRTIPPRLSVSIRLFNDLFCRILQHRRTIRPPQSCIYLWLRQCLCINVNLLRSFTCQILAYTNLNVNEFSLSWFTKNLNCTPCQGHFEIV